MPRLTLVPRCHFGAAIAGAFERHAKRSRWALLQFIEAQFYWLVDETTDGECPILRRGDERDIEMYEQVVQAGGCQIIAQRLQQRARVAVRQAHFVTRKGAVGERRFISTEEGIFGV